MGNPLKRKHLRKLERSKNTPDTVTEEKSVVKEVVKEENIVNNQITDSVTSESVKSFKKKKAVQSDLDVV